MAAPFENTKTEVEFLPSTYQQALFDWVVNGTGSAIVEAVAGAGKTTTIVQALNFLPTNLEIAFLAFNKDIVIELKKKLPAHVNGSTFHSIALKAWLKGRRNVKIENNNFKKPRDIFYRWVDAYVARKQGNDSMQTGLIDTYCDFVVKLVTMAKHHGLAPAEYKGRRLVRLQEDSYDNFMDIVDHYEITFESEAATYEAGIKIAREVLAISIKEAFEGREDLGCKSYVDFDDMLYMALIANTPFPLQDWVFVDECQDSNPVRRALVKRMLKKGGRTVWVGDRCQPEGTMVELCNKPSRFKVSERIQTPIENIKVGDFIASYNFNCAESFARRVNGVSCREYNEDLVVITTPENKSRYTLNHICIVKNAFKGYCVYLMKKGDAYRIGMSKLNNENLGVGPYLRTRHEGADAIWILDLYETRNEALKYEMIISMRFKLPTIMFTVKSETAFFTQDELSSVWADVKNEEDARKCLEYFGRDIQYPYFYGQGSDQKKTLVRPHEVRACNILKYSKVMLRSPPKPKQERSPHNEKWVDAIITREHYEGKVYSLDVDKDEVYFADGILTHNCQAIYGFTGADPQSMDAIKNEFNCICLPLTISYRCPKAVVAFARQWVSHIESAPNAPEGVVGVMQTYKPETFRADDVILCRLNAPLVTMAFQLFAHRVPCKIAGRDFGKQVLTLIKNMKAVDLADLKLKLEAYRTREVAALASQGKENAAQTVDDKVESVFAVIDGLAEDERTIKGLNDTITKIFDIKDENGNKKQVLTLSTVHKAKGKEWNRVFALDRAKTMPSKWARQAWQQEQEINLLYVMVTRAKMEFYDIQTQCWDEANDNDEAEFERQVEARAEQQRIHGYELSAA